MLSTLDVCYTIIYQEHWQNYYKSIKFSHQREKYILGTEMLGGMEVLSVTFGKIPNKNQIRKDSLRR